MIQANLPFTLSIIFLLWAIHFVNVIVGYRLNILGVYPRSLWGLIGIPFFSFLHGDFNHLFFNSIPLFVLMNLVLLKGMPQFFCVTETIILIGGLGVWLFGRKALHIGASCVVMGYFSYLMVDAYEHPSIITLILAVVILYYFGFLLAHIFPLEERMSWEGHVFGFIGGIAANFWCLM